MRSTVQDYLKGFGMFSNNQGDRDQRSKNKANQDVESNLNFLVTWNNCELRILGNFQN